MSYAATSRLQPAAYCLFAALCCFSLGAQEPPKAQPTRTWTSVNGNTVDGAFVREENGKIFIKRPDGSMLATTREKLSPLDLAWIDGAAAPTNAVQTLTFTKATQLETTKMEQYKLVRRLIVKTYTLLTNNDRDDKMLAFLLNDARYGWRAINADCYLTPKGKKGKLKKLSCTPQAPVPLREAVQMTRDKFVLIMPDTVTLQTVSEDGENYWELKNPTDYITRVLLLIDPETKNIKRFDLYFPPPANERRQTISMQSP